MNGEIRMEQNSVRFIAEVQPSLDVHPLLSLAILDSSSICAPLNKEQPVFVQACSVYASLPRI